MISSRVLKLKLKTQDTFIHAGEVADVTTTGIFAM